MPPLGHSASRGGTIHWQLLGAVGAIRLSWSQLALLVECDVLHQPGAGVLPGRSAEAAEITHSASSSRSALRCVLVALSLSDQVASSAVIAGDAIHHRRCKSTFFWAKTTAPDAGWALCCSADRGCLSDGLEGLQSAGMTTTSRPPGVNASAQTRGTRSRPNNRRGR